MISNTARNALAASVSLALAALLGGAGSATAQDNAMSVDALVAALKEGGLVAYIRHATTESDYADQLNAEMGDCSTQRVLSEEGWQEAKAIGAAFADNNIPVGTVLSSEYCRAWQTADLAFGQYQKSASLNFEPAEDYSDAQIAAMRERVLPLLEAAPDGANLVIVGHDDPFEAATGIYPEPMGVTYVLRPDASGPQVLGHIAPDDWPS